MGELPAKKFYKNTKMRGFFCWFFFAFCIFNSNIKKHDIGSKSDKVCVGNYNSFIGHILLSIERLFM